MKSWLFGLIVVGACWPRDLYRPQTYVVIDCSSSGECFKTMIRMPYSRSKHSVESCVYETIDITSGESWVYPSESFEGKDDG